MPSKYINSVFLLTLYFLVAAAAFTGFASKWGFRDGNPRFALGKILDGSADKPFVYRRLLPEIANIVEGSTPPKIVNTIAENYYFGPFRYYSKSSILKNVTNDYKFKWILIYWMSFGCLFASLFLIRSILLTVGVGNSVAILAPCVFCLCIPIIQTVGGYYYDFSELMFMSLAFFAAIQNRLLLLLPIVVLATLNKESFLFYLPTLYPFLHISNSKLKNWLYFTFIISVSASVSFWIKSLYANNAGSVAEFHFYENLRNYLNPLTYLQFDDSYGLITPRGLNILNLILILFLVKTAWKHFDEKVKKHCYVALFINLPLFLVFCFTNEIRNLSFLYIPLVFLIAYTLKCYAKPELSSK